MRGFLRRDAFRHIAEQQTQDRAERVRREAEERRQTRARHAIPNWQGYLESEAAQGNETAIAVLRSRMQRRTQMESQLLEAQDAGEARHIVYRHLRPMVRRDGRTIYCTADGGVVCDDDRTVRVNQVTAGASLLALTLARDRFGPRPLVVRGTDEFRAQIARLAGTEGLDVMFADGRLERQRAMMRNERANRVDRGSSARAIYDRTDSRTERDHGR